MITYKLLAVICFLTATIGAAAMFWISLGTRDIYAAPFYLMLCILFGSAALEMGMPNGR